MEEARAVSVLSSDRSIDEKRGAIETIKTLGGRTSLGILNSVSSSIDVGLKGDLDAAIALIESEQQLWDMAQNVWYGLSLGSVLLLAATACATPSSSYVARRLRLLRCAI